MQKQHPSLYSSHQKALHLSTLHLLNQYLNSQLKFSYITIKAEKILSLSYQLSYSIIILHQLGLYPFL